MRVMPKLVLHHKDKREVWIKGIRTLMPGDCKNQEFEIKRNFIVSCLIID